MRIAIDPFKKHRPQRPSPGVELTFRPKTIDHPRDRGDVCLSYGNGKTSEPVLDNNIFVARCRYATCFCLVERLREKQTSTGTCAIQPWFGGCNSRLAIVSFSEIINAVTDEFGRVPWSSSLEARTALPEIPNLVPTKDQ
jgi:hypothetical protein